MGLPAIAVSLLLHGALGHRVVVASCTRRHALATKCHVLLTQDSRGRMVHFRRERLGEQLQAELSDVILRELRDPRVGFVTVTEVRMSADLKHARVYVSVFGSEEEKPQALAALERAAGFLKREIGSRLNLRYVPELKFVQDDTLERSARIDALLSGSESDDDE